MRSFDESMGELTAIVERNPGGHVGVVYRDGAWIAWLYIGTRIEARSCEAEKALDALASKIEEALTR